MLKRLALILLLLIPLSGCGNSTKEISDLQITCSETTIMFKEYKQIVEKKSKSYQVRLDIFLKSKGNKEPVGKFSADFPLIAYSLNDLMFYSYIDDFLAGRFITIYIDPSTVSQEEFHEMGMCVKNNILSVQTYLKNTNFYKRSAALYQMESSLGALIYGSLDYFMANTADSFYNFNCGDGADDYAKIHFDGSVYRISGPKTTMLWNINLPNEEGHYTFSIPNYLPVKYRDISDCSNKDNLNIEEFFANKDVYLKDTTPKYKLILTD